MAVPQRAVLLVQVCDIATLHSLTTTGLTGYILSNEARTISGSTREKFARTEFSLKSKRILNEQQFHLLPRPLE